MSLNLKSKSIIWRLTFVSLLFIFGTSTVFYNYFYAYEFDKNLTTRIDETSLNGSLFTGLMYSWHVNYRPQRMQWFWKGRPIGTDYVWYPNGVLQASRPYKNGVPHGDWKQWYPDGKVRSLRHFEEGLIDGEMWTWHQSGQISDYNRLDKGKEVSHKSWLFDGTPFYNYVYQEGRKVGMLGGDFCKPQVKLK